MNPEVIRSEPDWMMTFHPSESRANALVISFNEMGGDKTETGFGSEFLKKNGYDHIFVADRKGTFYQGLSWQDFKEFVAPISNRYERVVTYGVSLGGYCALYYAGAVNATALALAPRLPPHPYCIELINIEQEIRAVRIEHVDLAGIPCSDKTPIVVYDPVNVVDMAFVERFCRPVYPDIIEFTLPYCGHLVAMALLKHKLLVPFASSVLDGGEVLQISIPPPEFPYFHITNAYAAMKERDFDAAEIHVHSAVEKSHEIIPFSLILSFIQRSGRPYKNIPKPSIRNLRDTFGGITKKISSANDDSAPLWAMAEAHLSLCQFDEALRLAEKARMLERNIGENKALWHKIVTLAKLQQA